MGGQSKEVRVHKYPSKQANITIYFLKAYDSISQCHIMADEEIATKAPENDAQESLVAGDTAAQEGASMGVSILTYLKDLLLIRCL